MEIQSIKGLSSTHCPLVPLGKGHNSAKNIVPATETSPAGAAVQGREPGNERRQLGLQGRDREVMGLLLPWPCHSHSWCAAARAQELLSSLHTGSSNCLWKLKIMFISPKDSFAFHHISAVMTFHFSSARTTFIYITSISLLRFSPPNYLCVIEGLEVSLKEILEDRKCSRISAILNCSIQSCSLKKITWTYFIRRLLYTSTGALQNIYFW